MSFVWRTGTGGTHAPLSAHALLGPRIGITCQVVLGFVYFVLVLRAFRNYSEVGRKPRVVQRLVDEQIELETTHLEWVRGRDNVHATRRAAPRAEEEGVTTREGRRVYCIHYDCTARALIPCTLCSLNQFLPTFVYRF
jgi:hypothetical protein